MPLLNASPIYANSLTPEAKSAFYARDKDALASQVKNLAKQLGALSTTDANFYPLSAKLMVTTALFDSLNGGAASMFVCDYVNF